MCSFLCSHTFIRYGAILAALTPGKVLLHGGTGSWPHLYMQNTAEYDTSMNVWTDLSGKIGATESTRFHAATILNSTDLYIFAGEAAASSVDLTFKTNVTSASCPSGHATEYCMETTSVVCRPCPAGTYAPPNVVSYVCTDCASGSYNPDVTQDVCVECPKGKHGTGSDGAADGTHCVDCSAGRYSNAFKAPSSSSCGICTSGSFSSLAAWNCTSCDAGTSSTAESETCGACPSGKYSSAAAPECIDCDPGYHQPSPSSSSCDICVAGTASPTASADCTDCDAGYYSSSDGASECTACDPGTYQTAAAQAECDDCVVGKKSSATAATSSGTCSKCSKGKFGASTGLSSCSDCVAGKHQDRKGQESCDDCEFGKYVREPSDPFVSPPPFVHACVQVLHGSTSDLRHNMRHVPGRHVHGRYGLAVAGCLQHVPARQVLPPQRRRRLPTVSARPVHIDAGHGPGPGVLSLRPQHIL